MEASSPLGSRVAAMGAPLAPRRLLPVVIVLLCGSAQVAGAIAASRFRGSSRSGAGSRSGTMGFNYENHGGDWHMGQCGSREQQSPIDFGPLAPWASRPGMNFFYDYEPLQGSWEVRNTGTAVAADLDGQGFGGIEYKNKRYTLSSVNFHMHSEHTFRGKAMPMEAHIVHKSEDSDNHALIVAVPFIVQEPPPTYTYMGPGACPSGFYAGWNPADAVSFAACVNKCNSEPQCQYIAMAANKSCSRYSAGAGLCSPLQNFTDHFTYKKVLAPNNYVLLGSGHCPGYTTETAAASPEACQSQCSLSPDCAFASYSEEKRCMLFSQGQGPCSNRTAGTLNFVTYQKRDPAISTALEGLLDLSQSLPEAGKARIRSPPMPVDVIGDFLKGGTFFEYEGSLTAPPCTEGVTWLVRREALVFSCDQQQKFADSILKMTSDIGNYRAIMPLFGRKISVVAAASGPPPKPPPAPHVPGMPIAVQSMSNIWAAEAQKWAWHAQDLAGNVSGIMQAFPSPGVGALPPFIAPPRPMTLGAAAGLLAMRRPVITSVADISGQPDEGASLVNSLGRMASMAELDATRSYDLGHELVSELAVSRDSEGPPADA